ncbi:hypothetical protein ACFWPU_30560 [Streptomyces sp. NPDC058471]|uniref:hypothetical protein n=1 Tax=Streptomyces sp. NPDC058471 TaxID=3346516 RepID=UPI003655EAC7
MPITEVRVEFAALKRELESGEWAPSPAEFAAAHDGLLNIADNGPLHALGAGVVLYLPEESRLTPLFDATADILETPDLAGTGDAKDMVQDLTQLLHGIGERKPADLDLAPYIAGI